MPAANQLLQCAFGAEHDLAWGIFIVPANELVQPLALRTAGEVEVRPSFDAPDEATPGASIGGCTGAPFPPQRTLKTGLF